MSLLRENQNNAAKFDWNVLALLRERKVLASRLRHARLGQWVQQGLDDYSDNNELPDYRKAIVHNKGHFSWAFGSGILNSTLQPMRIRKELSEGITFRFHLPAA